MMAATQYPTTGPARLGRRLPPSRSRPVRCSANRKLASGFFRSAPPSPARKVASLTLGAHQENSVLSYDIASGCVVAPDSAGANAQLQQAIAIRDRNLSHFTPGGQYAQYAAAVGLVELASVGGTATSLGLGLRAQQLAAQAARDGTILDQGRQLTYYTSVTPSQAQARAFAGGLVAAAGVGLDAFTLGTAIVNRDGAAASLSAGNLGASFGAAAMGGPPGLVIAGGQAAINLTLLGYSGYQNYQDRINTQQSAQMSMQVIQQAQQVINRLSGGPGG